MFHRVQKSEPQSEPQQNSVTQDQAQAATQQARRAQPQKPARPQSAQAATAQSTPAENTSAKSKTEAQTEKTEKPQERTSNPVSKAQSYLQTSNSKSNTNTKEDKKPMANQDTAQEAQAPKEEARTEEFSGGPYHRSSQTSAAATSGYMPSYTSPYSTSSQGAPEVSTPNDRKLTIGRGITMSGEIESCDHLYVEGTVEAALKGAQVLDIAPSGVFYGTVEIGEATISGRFEGEIAVKGRLTVESTGVITGTISYGELQIESGAVIDGRLTPMAAAPAAAAQAPQAAPAKAPSAPAPAAEEKRHTGGLFKAEVAEETAA